MDWLSNLWNLRFLAYDFVSLSFALRCWEWGGSSFESSDRRLNWRRSLHWGLFKFSSGSSRIVRLSTRADHSWLNWSWVWRFCKPLFWNYVLEPLMFSMRKQLHCGKFMHLKGKNFRNNTEVWIGIWFRVSTILLLWNLFMINFSFALASLHIEISKEKILTHDPFKIRNDFYYFYDIDQMIRIEVWKDRSKEAANVRSLLEIRNLKAKIKGAKNGNDVCVWFAFSMFYL